MPESTSNVAVLVSGGLDSAILAADLAGRYSKVYPVYVRAGLSWEATEHAYLREFLRLVQTERPALQGLVLLEMPVGDLYGNHWSLTGTEIPGADTPDDAVYLPGRNLLLLSKAMLWCHLNHVPALALGVLASNPFPDARAGFFDDFEAVMNRAVEGRVKILRPYARLHKTEVLERGKGLPLEWTFSCMRPASGRHCGECNKCAERSKVFADLGWPDPTRYAHRGDA